MPLLRNGDPFPSLNFPRVGGGILALPGDLAGNFGVVLINRGAWCPFCNAQLAGFAHAADTWTELGVRVAALSVDDEAAASALVAKHRLTFPVGYGADAEQVAAATGAFTNDQPRYLQATGFVLDPAGRVLTAVYSTGAIGRLVAADVAGFIRYVQSHQAA